VTVLLPTVRWTDACDEVAAQLGSDDELLILHDHETDAVADHEPGPEGVRFVAAGSPVGCSGKANAIAAGVQSATTDRLVLTDDDFHHPPTWLATMQADYERHGPVTELPLFVGRDPLAVLLEPLYLVAVVAGLYAGRYPWGGAVIFDRSDLELAAFLTELTQTVSDDGLLGEHVETTAVRRFRRVPVGGRLHQSVERHVRFTQIAFAHNPVTTAVGTVGLFALGVGCLVAPLLAALVTGGAAALFIWADEPRWSAGLAVPVALLIMPLAVYALARSEFTWAGRRYRWRSKFNVQVVDD
jgi:hypothetical protein